jgi:diacylglycerol kinase
MKTTGRRPATRNRRPTAGDGPSPAIHRPPATGDRPPPAPRPAPATRAATLLASFGYAFAGLRYLLWTQRNARIHMALGLLAVTAGFFFRIGHDEWLALVLTITLVLTTEGCNTALEAAVDLASPELHPLAKIAKDVSAGAVLLAAIASVIVGLIIFLPRLWALVAP